jgi:hypothetical protein
MIHIGSKIFHIVLQQVLRKSIYNEKSFGVYTSISGLVCAGTAERRE